MDRNKMDRRAFVKATALTVAGLGAASALPAKAFTPIEDEKHAREYDSNKALLDTLKYVDKSEEADKDCLNCQFYVATNDTMGKCQLIPKGLVAAEGYCISWVKKV